jgi:hypothetical protein
MSLWDKAWPGGSIRLGLPNGAAPLDGSGRMPVAYLPLEALETSELRTENFDVPPGIINDVDTRNGGFTGTLPAEKREGQRFFFNDFAGTWGTNNFIIDGNGSLFGDGGTRLVCNTPACFWVFVGAEGVLNVR